TQHFSRFRLLEGRENQQTKQKHSKPMKRTINALIATAVLGMLTAAYAVCYLEQVVLCFKAGDEIGSTSSLTVGACTSFTAHVFASENAYRIHTYSVTRGGDSETQFNSFCDPEDTVYVEMGSASQSLGNGFV